jgi:CRISPR-associated protein (TIGR02710 family)
MMRNEQTVTERSEAASRPKAMILCVGGSPSPIVVSLNRLQPEHACFFMSADSQGAIESAILPELSYRPRHHDWIQTPSAEDLLACYGTLQRELPRLAEKWRVPLAEWVADYTGGTKTMSVALGLATIQTVGRYSYVGGSERTKEGLGAVVNGKERLLQLTNPWDALAVAARQRASLLFSRGRYEAAAEEYDGVADKVSPSEQSVFQALANLARGYAAWDRFAHGPARDLLFRSLRVLEPFAQGKGETPWSKFVSAVRRDAEFLDRLGVSDGIWRKVADLIANARRRGDLESRYDDAVARLYSALEMAGRIALETRHGVRPSRVLPEQVPPSLREEFRRRYETRDRDGAPYLKLPHFAAFRLLGELGDDLGQRYFAREEEIRKLLDQRNASILAHGDRPVGEGVFRKLLPTVCEVAGITEADLPDFPDLPA